MTDASPVSVLSRFAGPQGRARTIRALCDQRPVLGSTAIAEALLDRGTLRLFDPGEDLIVEGEWTNDIHFVLAGSVRVHLNGSPIIERASGVHVGEAELIDNSRPRAASVTALEPTVALCVPEGDFSEIAAEAPDMWRQIAKVMAERLTAQNRFVRRSNSVPRLFLCSATESLPAARAFRRRLTSEHLVADIWYGGTLKPAEHALESLGEELRKADFALAIFSPDDIVESRGQTMAAPRDNTVYELGLFAGAIGRARSFYATQRGTPVKIPSDLGGVTGLRYTVNENGSPRYDITDACDAIRERICALGVR